MKFGSVVCNPFVTLRCNYRCPYCITRHGEVDFNYTERSAAEWTAALNSLEDVRDFVFNGGEPGLFKGFSAIVNGIGPRHLIAIGTNASDAALPEILAIEPRHELVIDVSYHPAMAALEGVILRVKTLRERFARVRVHAVSWPGYEGLERNALDLIHQQAGVETFVQPFEGFFENNFHAGGHSMKAEATNGKARRVNCYHTIYTPIAPNGDVYTCNTLMYRRGSVGILGNVFDGFLPGVDSVECDRYGQCNPCDFPRKVVPC